MPPCPQCRKVHPIECGLRLFNSDNECPICMEKSSTMIALPCGHQYCQDCLEKIGMKTSGDNSVSSSIISNQRLPIRPVIDLTRPVQRQVSSIQRHVQNRLRQVRRAPPVRRRRIRRRCGWCGHIGHTQRKCKKHRQNCGCSRLNGATHSIKLRTQHKCVICFKRGHHWRTCAAIVKGFK